MENLSKNQYDQSELSKFRVLNPGRHGYDSTGLCMVCGIPVIPNCVYCKSHKGTFEVSWGREDWFTLLYNHPDFNGIKPGSTLCAICDRWILGTDYICPECRSE